MTHKRPRLICSHVNLFNLGIFDQLNKVEPRKENSASWSYGYGYNSGDVSIERHTCLYIETSYGLNSRGSILGKDKKNFCISQS
jgi:hypothetical protein